MKSFRLGRVASALIAIGLVACTTTVKTTSTEGEAFAARLIAEKVAAASEAHGRYVALVAEEQQIVARKQVALDTDTVDVDYIGKPQELLQTFAYRYGYQYLEVGKRQDLRTINLRVQQASPIEVLKNVGLQIDGGADVVLDKNARTLRLIYKNFAPRKG